MNRDHRAREVILEGKNWDKLRSHPCAQTLPIGR